MTDSPAGDCAVCGAPTRLRAVRWGFPFRVCPGCGLEFVHPQPDDAALGRIYGEAYYDAWGLKGGEAPVRRMKRAGFAMHLRRLGPPAAGARLVECGAATGFLVELARELGWSPFAVELSDFGSAACARILGADRVFRGQAQDSRFAANPDGRFEAAVMIDFIEHVRDPRSVLRWAADRLVPGGRILLVTPRAGGTLHRVMGRAWPHYKPEHLWYFRPSNLARLLRETGFGDVVLRPAWKTLAPAYAETYFARYRNSLLSPVAKALSALPDAVRTLPIPVLLGEMLLTARRR